MKTGESSRKGSGEVIIKLKLKVKAFNHSKRQSRQADDLPTDCIFNLKEDVTD